MGCPIVLSCEDENPSNRPSQPHASFQASPNPLVSACLLIFIPVSVDAFDHELRSRITCSALIHCGCRHYYQQPSLFVTWRQTDTSVIKLENPARITSLQV